MERFLEGLQKVEDGRYRIIETMMLDKDRYTKLSLTESIIEAKGVKYPVNAIYEFKVWDNQFNLNGRNYGKVLNKVIQENIVTLGFTNHPNDGKEDVNQTYSIQRNPHMKEGWLCIDVCFVGTRGRLAEEILEKGGPIAISSSALGDLDTQGNVLDEGFELERYGDWVWQGANNQQQFKDDVDSKTIGYVNIDYNESVQEGIKEVKTTPIDSEVTIYNKEGNKVITEKQKGEINMDKAEKTMVLNIKGMIREASKIEDLKEKLSILEEALPFADDVSDKSLTETISVKINDIKEELNILAEKGKTVKEKDEQIITLTETNVKLQEELDELKTKHEETVGMYEASIKKEEETTAKFDETVEALRKENIDLIEQNKIILAEANTKVDADKYMALKAKLAENVNDGDEKNNKSDKTSLAEKRKAIRAKIVEARKAEERRTTIRKAIKDRRKAKQEEVEIEESTFLNEDVESYYDDLAKTNKAFKEYKEVFEVCNTLEEAQKLVITKDQEIPERKTRRVIKEQTETPAEPKELNGLSKYLAEKNYK